jgi:hypothetical protein
VSSKAASVGGLCLRALAKRAVEFAGAFFRWPLLPSGRLERRAGRPRLARWPSIRLAEFTDAFNWRHGWSAIHADMELFRAEKVAEVASASTNKKCRCGETMKLIRTILVSDTGNLMHMFECTCGERVWDD